MDKFKYDSECKDIAREICGEYRSEEFAYGQAEFECEEHVWTQNFETMLDILRHCSNPDALFESAGLQSVEDARDALHQMSAAALLEDVKREIRCLRD